MSSNTSYAGRIISQEELDALIKKHQDWLEEKPGGERLVLVGTSLRNVKLRGADLVGADLRDADLEGADLVGVDLRDANLRDTNLRGANLVGADLRDADLEGADLEGANLMGADLQSADLRDANLQDTDLRNAQLANNRNSFLIGNFSAGQHLGVATLDYLAIGCKQHGWSFWLDSENIEEVGYRNSYKYTEIEEYEVAIRAFYQIRNLRMKNAED